ncbi:MAG: hypothetical protein V4819_26055 [Verrucomicrobiota bacterium]
MKSLPLLLVALSVNASAQLNGFQSFIRQTQQPETPYESLVEWDMPVEATGTASSALELPAKGSLFQLWSIDQATVKDYLLDQKLVGAYLPKADIKITTLDPYPLVRRTRVDQPFSVEIQVADLLTGTGMPDAATKVLLEQHVQSYVDGNISLDPSVVAANTPLHSSYITQNGSTVMSFPAASLKASDPGEEHFIVHALSDGTTTQSQIASAKVQVWPLASGAIFGITQGEELEYMIPKLQLNLNDLYPRSDTYLMVYEGAYKAGEINGVQGKLVKAFPMDRDRSLSTILEVTELSSAIGADGAYTIALMSETVFDTRLLCEPITFSVKRTIAVNAMQVNFTDGTEPGNP